MNQISAHRKNIFYKKGISIVETVVALLILGTIGAALLALTVQIQSATNSAKFKSVAEAQAQKMLEQARNKRNVDGGMTGWTPGCYADGNLSAGQGCVCTSTSITGRVIVVDNLTYKGFLQVSDDNGGKKVQATVGWKEKNKNNCLRVDTYLYDY